VTELASKADIILNAADADDLGLLKAILVGCQQKFTTTSVKSIYIHTSGTAVFMDDAEGVFNPATPVYDVSHSPCRTCISEIVFLQDRNSEAIKSILPTAPHRNVEQRLVSHFVAIRH
jgi:hypothetical protein